MSASFTQDADCVESSDSASNLPQACIRPDHTLQVTRVDRRQLDQVDFMVPYETNQRVLFEALGSKDKNFSRYDGGHANLLTRPDLIAEVLDWFDKYLGPVNQQP